MDRTTETLARYATSLRYADLGAPTVQAAKRHLIDSLGCAIGGYGSEPAVIARRVAPAWHGAPVGAASRRGTRDDARGRRVRQLRDDPLSRRQRHVHRARLRPSQRHAGRAPGRGAKSPRASGKDLLLATSSATRCSARLADQVPLRDRGWDQSVFVAPASAAGAGFLLGLSADQMADAIAIAVTANVATRQTRAGELAMWKGCATATAAKAGLFAAQLAREGMTGPTAAFEGRHGLWRAGDGALRARRARRRRPVLRHRADELQVLRHRVPRAGAASRWR